MLRLSQAASSEYFSEWGEPPNQRRTGESATNPGGNMDGELNIIPFYGGWQWAFRAKDPNVAEKMAWLSERIVANGRFFGYGQDNGDYPRTGVFDLLEDEEDPLDVTFLANTDCSAKMGACVYHAGVKDRRLRDMWTGTERDILLSTGQFVELKDPLLLSIGTGLRRGDILLKKGHTAMCLDDDDHLDTVPYRLTDCAACNIRTGPGTEYEIIGVLHGGDIVQVVSTAKDDWKKIVIPEGFGYVSGKYCRWPLADTRATGDTWLRKTPGTSGEQIIVIPKDAKVYLTGEEKIAFSFGIPRKWLEVIFATHQGWASSLYIEE